MVEKKNISTLIEAVKLQKTIMDLQLSSIIIILTFLVTLIRSSESELRRLNSDSGSVIELSKNVTNRQIQSDFQLQDEIRVNRFDKFSFEDSSATENYQTRDLNGVLCKGIILNIPTTYI